MIRKDDEMLKIGLVIPSLQSGGMERVMSELTTHFAGKENIELHLILYGKKREIFYPLPKKVKVHKPSWPFNDNLRLLSTLKTLLWLRSRIKQINPDTVLSFGEYWNSFVLLALKGTRYPVFVSDRCKPDKYLGKLHEFLRTWLYPRAAGVVVQTGKAREVYLQKELNRNIRLIGNPIREISSDGGPQEKENIILTVGRLINTKHHDRLIEIFDQVKKEDWKLIIIGGNAIKQDNMSQLKGLIEEKGLQGHVILAGTITNVEEYYLKSKIFAFTSSSEGFPNAVGEAMSAGIPVVAYDCVAGPADMIEDGVTGYLVDLFDDESFIIRVKELMHDGDLRKKMGEHSKKKIKDYSVEAIGERYFEFITENRSSQIS